MAALGVLPAYADTLPSPAAVRAAHVPSEAWLLDRHGTPLQRFRVDAAVRRLDWVVLADLSPAMRIALVAAEDRRFYEHDGVDWQAFAAAAWRNLWRGGQRPHGASTLSMQLAAMLDPALKAGGSGRTLAQKWDQSAAALELEKHWSKGEILETYLNLARFRGELAGIGAAARGLFGKDASGLDGDEAAILVALLRGPAATPATVGRRACGVAASAAEAAARSPASSASGKLARPATSITPKSAQGAQASWSAAASTTSAESAVAAAAAADTRCAAIRATVSRALTLRPRLGDVPGLSLAPQLRRLAGAAGSRTTVSLDREVQQLASDALSEQLALLADQDARDGAVIVLDNRSGEVIAAVGRQSADATVDPAVSRRQAGSTLKPFLYGLAFEQGLITAASTLDDSPLAIDTGAGLYAPQNYDRDFKGPVSARTALAASLNVPAVRVLGLVGVEAFRTRLVALGLSTLHEAGGYYGAALALGSPEVTLLELANAYRALANGGRVSAVRWSVSASSSSSSFATPMRRVMDSAAAFVVADILADRGARAMTFGFDNALATRSWSAVKTGTSKDMRDNWCLGFSNRYTVGVWIGNADGQPMRDVSGVSGAAPVWRTLMHALHATIPSRPPAPPRGLVRVAGAEAGGSASGEWFLAGTDSGQFFAVAEADHPAIISPAEGSILAIDPDIPPQFQRLWLTASPRRAGDRWRVDGESVADEMWKLTPGPHRIELLDGDDAVLDTRQILVRGELLPAAD